MIDQNTTCVILLMDRSHLGNRQSTKGLPLKQRAVVHPGLGSANSLAHLWRRCFSRRQPSLCSPSHHLAEAA